MLSLRRSTPGPERFVARLAELALRTGGSGVRLCRLCRRNILYAVGGPPPPAPPPCPADVDGWNI